MTPSAALRALLTPGDDLTSRLLPPLMRIVLVAFVLFRRFVGGDDQLRRTLHNRPTELIIAPHLEAALGACSAWPPPPWLVDAMGPTLIMAAVCVIVGLATRVALLTSTVLFIVLYGIVAGFGFFNHTPALGAQVMIALLVAPGTANLSVDLAIRRWWRRRRQPGMSSSSSSSSSLLPATPPLGAFLILLTVGLVYFASGVAKLRYGGMDWFDGTTLQFYLAGGSRGAQTWLFEPGTNAVVAYTYMAQPSSLALFVARSQPLCALLSWATVIVEAGAPVFLMTGPRARLGWCVMAVGFHLAVLQMMGISFLNWIVIDVVIAIVTGMGLRQARPAQSKA